MVFCDKFPSLPSWGWKKTILFETKRKWIVSSNGAEPGLSSCRMGQAWLWFPAGPLPRWKVKMLVAQCPTLCNPWTVAHQAPLSMRFSRQEYCSGLSFPPPGDLSPGIKPGSPTLQADSFPSEPPGKPLGGLFIQLSKPQCSYLESGDNNLPFLTLLYRSSETVLMGST